MLILKNQLVLGNKKDKDGYYRYRFDLGNISINIPSNLIDNNWVKPYLLKRLALYHRVCYTDLWLNEATYKEAKEAENQLGVIPQ